MTNPEHVAPDPQRIALAAAQPMGVRDLSGCQWAVAQRRAHPAIGPGPESLARRARMVSAEQAVWDVLPERAARGDRIAFRRRDVAPEGPSISEENARWLREMATLDALASGAHLITGAAFSGVFEGVAWAVEVPVLVRVGEAYMPVVISNHRIGRRAERGRAQVIATARLGLGRPLEEKFKVKAYAHEHNEAVLAAWGLRAAGLDSGLAGIIGQDRTRTFVVELDRFEQATVAAMREPIPAGPLRVRECDGCRFWHLCEPELQARDDISLLFRGDKARQFRELGFGTVAGLAAAGLGEASALAQAYRDGVDVLARARVQAVPRRDVEIDLDVEAYLDHGAYLWGLWDGQVYHGFATWDGLGAAAEGENFARMWGWLRATIDGARAAGQTVGIYCYASGGENHWLRSSARRFGGQVYAGVRAPSLEEVEEFIASDEWIDVFVAVKGSLIGTGGVGLKVVAAHAGFHWRESGFAGEESVSAYREARGIDPGDPSAARARLLDYNEDDCRATSAVREWLSAGAPGVRRVVD